MVRLCQWPGLERLTDAYTTRVLKRRLVTYGKPEYTVR